MAAAAQWLGTAVGNVSRSIQQWFHQNRSEVSALGATFSNLATIARVAFATVSRVLKTTLAPAVLTAKLAIGTLSVAFKALSPVILPVLRLIGDQLKAALDVLEGVIEVFAGVLTLHFGKAWKGVKDIFHGVLSGLTSLLKDQIKVMGAAATGIGNAIGSGLSKTFGGIVSTARKFVNAIIDVINALPFIPNIKHSGAAAEGRAAAADRDVAVLRSR